MRKSNKPYVFVIMPFAKEFQDIYNLGIKPACTEAGAYCDRVDEQIFSESILERIYNQINKADIIVAELTGRNPNVFYETGFAHALEKEVILLTQRAEDIPFDLKHYPHIVYDGNITDLKDKLKKRISWFVKNPNKKLKEDADINLEFFINGSRFKENGVLSVTIDKDKIAKLSNRTNPNQKTLQVMLNLDIHNPNQFIVEGKVFQVGIMMPRIFETTSDISIVRISESDCIFLLPQTNILLPDGWTGYSILLSTSSLDNVISKKHECRIRLFTQLGTKDYSFKLEVKTE